MPTDHRAALAKIRGFDQLIAYLSPAQKIEATIDRDPQVLVLFPVDLAIAFGDELGYGVVLRSRSTVPIPPRRDIAS